MIIYNSKGEKRIEFEPDSSSQNEMGVMLCNTITLSFAHFQRVQLEVNDYILFEGERFALGDMYQPVHKNSQQYAYEGIKFYGTIGDCRKALVLKMVNDSSESEFSLTASLRDHLELVVENINRVKGGHDWVVGSTAVEVKNMTITYSSLFCIDALNKIAEAFETEWWVEGYTINAIKAEFGPELELGYGAGLLDLSRNENKTARFFTRLYPVGGTRNIDKTKYGYERLQLPGGAKYVDRNTELGVVEASEREAFAHIYPRRIGTVGVVRSEPAKMDGVDRLRYFFSDPGLTFDPNKYIMDAEKIMIAFQSGELNGRDFEVGYKDGEFEIKNVYPTPEVQIPGGAFVPKGGDEYILYNIRMPDEYYPMAEEEYKKAVDEYIAKYSEDTAIYRAKTDYLYLGEREITIRVGRRVKLVSDNFEGGGRSSRVTKITRRLNDPLILDLEISNAISKTRLETVENAVVDIKATLKEQNSKKELQVLRSWDSTDPSDYNVFSSLKALITLARLKGGNIFRGVQTFFDELRSSDYVAGLTGWSIRRLINGRWGMEIGSLVLHDFLEVPELRFNRKDVVSGELWNSIAFGTIESVDVVEKIVTVKLLDGELLSSHVGDINQGMFHNLLSTSSDEDGNGFLRMKGFATSYFTPTELLPDGKSFRYELQPDTTFHPCKSMKFVCYGSFVDKTRQVSAYSTRTYKRYLSGVNTWTIDPNKHIMAQFGDIDGLTIGGVTMKGHGSFQKNMYMTGVHIQFTPEQLEDIKGKDAYNVSLSTYEGVVKLSAEGSVPDMTKDVNVVTEGKNVVTGDKNVVTQIYSLTTHIQAFRGDTELFFSTLPTKGAYNVTLSPHGCDAVVSAGVLTVLNITNTEDCYVEMTVNCEGNAIFEKRYTVALVKDGDKGESGESAYIIDLDNENDSVACDHAGNLLDIENLPTTNAFVYCGSSLDLGWNYIGVFAGCKGVVANVTNDKGVVESGKITLTAITADKATVVVTALKEGIAELKTTFTVSKIKGGADGTPATRWWFTPSVNVIRRSANGENDPSALQCTPQRQIGNNPIESFDVNGAPGFTVFYRFDGGTEYPFPGFNNEIYISSVKKYVDLSLKENKTGQEYDSERICVVQDGSSGAPGNDGNDGAPGNNYSLVASVTQITRNSIHRLTPDKFSVSSFVNDTPYSTYLAVYGFNGGTWVKLNTVFKNSIIITPSLQYRLYTIKSHLQDNATFDSQALASVTVSVIESTEELRARLVDYGKWSADKNYTWNEDRRPYVFKENGPSLEYYLLNVYNTEVSGAGKEPGVSSGWENYWKQGNVADFTVTNVHIADSGKIAKFNYINNVLSSEKMVTINGVEEPNTSWDAESGRFVCNEGVFRGFIKTDFHDINSEIANDGSVSLYKIDKWLNISLNGYNTNILLPSDSSYIGSVINIADTWYPPWSRTGMLFCSYIFVEPDTGGIGGTFTDTWNSQNTFNDPICISIKGSSVQLIGLPGDNCTHWSIMNYSARIGSVDVSTSKLAEYRNIPTSAEWCQKGNTGKNTGIVLCQVQPQRRYKRTVKLRYGDYTYYTDWKDNGSVTEQVVRYDTTMCPLNK